MSDVPAPVRPPVAPMLATLARQLPTGDFRYEPKWDGFRGLAFRHGDQVALRSRNQRPFERYFPELAEALLAVPAERFVLDGEIVVAGPGGLDFAALMMRLHPSASRVARLRAETPASYVAFDLLAVGDDDLRATPLSERRDRLERLLAGSPPALVLTPVTADAAQAREWLERFTGGGIDGVVAKDPRSPYEPGRRSKSWVKVKPERTADCVVGGFRLVEGADEPLVSSLLLGLYDGSDALRHTGVASSFPVAERRQLLADLRPLVTGLAGHPWEHGFALERGPMGRLKGAAGAWDPRTMARDWVPVRPERVCEVTYDQLDAGGRWRHPTRFRRWRPDRDPASCTFDQLALAPPERVSVVRRR